MQRQSFLNALDLKGQVLTELKCKKKKEKKKTWPDYVQERKSNIYFLDDFRSKMICNY